MIEKKKNKKKKTKKKKQKKKKKKKNTTTTETVHLNILRLAEMWQGTDFGPICIMSKKKCFTAVTPKPIEGPILLFYAPTQKVAGCYVIPSKIVNVRTSVSALIISVRSMTLIQSEIFSWKFTQM